MLKPSRHLAVYLFSLVSIVACNPSSDAPIDTPEGDDVNLGLPIDAGDPSVGALPLDCGDVAGGIVANNLDASARQHLLCLHNKTRSVTALGLFEGNSDNLPMAADMNALAWDDNLEQVAQNYANQCHWGHNPNRGEQYNSLLPNSNTAIAVGENLAFRSSTILTSADFDYALFGYDAWEEEGADYSYGELNVSDYCGVSACGHFTQLVWADTRLVGCAVSFCPANTLHDYPATYLVCNYASAGNYIGRNPYSGADSIADVCLGDAACKNGLIGPIDSGL